MIVDILDTPVYYINLQKDVDKRSAMEQMLESCGFTNVRRFEAIELSDKANAISASHLGVLQLIQASGKPAIVLEDDCILEDFKSVFEIPNDADAFYMGKSTFGLGEIESGLTKYSIEYNKVEQIDDHLFKVNSMYATHAIIYLTKEYVDFSIRVCKLAIKLSVPHDVYLGMIQPFYNIYARKVSLFSQTSALEWCVGDIDNYE